MLEQIDQRKLTLKEIFLDDGNFKKVVKKYGPGGRGLMREDSALVVEKMLSCGTIEMGYAIFGCPNCRRYRFVVYSCNTRFCNRCGPKRTDEWIERVRKRVFDVAHRHIVWTVPDNLWRVVALERGLMAGLSKIANKVMSYWEREKGFELGKIVIIHTFGARLNFNVHIHMAVSEVGITADDKLRGWSYIPFSFLTTAWRKQVLKFLNKELKVLRLKNEELRNLLYEEVKRYKVERGERFRRHGPSVRDVRDYLKMLGEKEWYVNAESRQRGAKGTILYTGRYGRRPSMAEVRLVRYDRERKLVTFWYEEKRVKWKGKGVNRSKKRLEKVRRFLTLPVEEFIIRLMRHIPDKHFRMIRYYGLYSNSKRKKSLEVMEAHGLYKGGKPNRLAWRGSIRYQRDRDPLICVCGWEMILVEKTYWDFNTGEVIQIKLPLNKASPEERWRERVVIKKQVAFRRYVRECYEKALSDMEKERGSYWRERVIYLDPRHPGQMCLFEMRLAA